MERGGEGECDKGGGGPRQGHYVGSVVVLGMSLCRIKQNWYNINKEDDNTQLRWTRLCVQILRRLLFPLLALLMFNNSTYKRHAQFQGVINYMCRQSINDNCEEDT